MYKWLCVCHVLCTCVCACVCLLSQLVLQASYIGLAFSKQHVAIKTNSNALSLSLSFFLRMCVYVCVCVSVCVCVCARTYTPLSGPESMNPPTMASLKAVDMHAGGLHPTVCCISSRFCVLNFFISLLQRVMLCT